MGAVFIAGDWGLSRLRLFLCGAGGEVLEERRGPGVSGTGDFPACLRRHLAGWDALPVVLCGMAGSTLGWKETPYVPAPASPAALARALTKLELDGRPVLIAPGVSAASVFGAPDVMRGEETQIAGALAWRTELAGGKRFFCLPGTHTKWVETADGVIQSITTCVTGELYDLVCRHASLGEGAPPWDGVPDEAFRLGLERSAAPLPHALFEARARRLGGELKAEEVRAFLSGVLIGSSLPPSLPQAPTVVVGEKALTALYAEALQRRGARCLSLDGNACAVRGLTAMYQAAVGAGQIA